MGSAVRSRVGRESLPRNRRVEGERGRLSEAPTLKLFLDSGALIARAIRNDRYHREATETFTEISQRRLPYRFQYTSNYVVDEVATFVLYEAGSRLATETLRRIRASPSLRVLHVTEEVESLADRVFERFASSRVSYTNCTTKVLMDRESIDTAFTFDRDLETLGFRRIP